ncbi:hypothetical protein M1B35_10835 [Pseudomonas sp. MAFF 302046]|uniref:Uncharacterized protein n=1 Tax=Pseudomonas morbosilactucae TaxID=2938197 RepID=A0ABT0JFA5_9PSED|nr:hypothetical protein [Pseudomonas morbosilactucae]MCK9814606.1 hypothetical protein [Pseudomonas morbosilactucae]
MSTTITLNAQRVQAANQALRALIEALRSKPIDILVQERADIEGRLRTLAALGLVDAEEEQELYYLAEAARLAAEEG